MKRLVNVLIAVIIVLILAGAGYYAYTVHKNNSSTASTSQYTAVALNSNELFFGRVTSETSKELVLEDVYFFTYVSANGSTASSSSSSSDNSNLKPTLIDTAAKDSLAPTSTYVFNRDQIKYTYPLKSDSQVVKTIDDYKNKNQ